jgi:hypothetical protein
MCLVENLLLSRTFTYQAIPGQVHFRIDPYNQKPIYVHISPQSTVGTHNGLETKAHVWLFLESLHWKVDPSWQKWPFAQFTRMILSTRSQTSFGFAQLLALNVEIVERWTSRCWSFVKPNWELSSLCNRAFSTKLFTYTPYRTHTFSQIPT